MTFSNVGKNRRLRKLFTDDKIVVVPIDDSVILGPKEGLLRLDDTVASICSQRPSALMGYRLGLEFVAQCRNDIPFIYNLSASTLLGVHTRKVLVQSVENALIAGADCVAVHVNMSSSYENEMLQNFASIANDCDRLGMPLLAVAYPRTEKQGRDYNYDDLKESNCEAYAELVAHTVRVACELGADIIKTQYTGSASSFKLVTEAACGKPVITAGGPKTSVQESLNHVVGAINGGGAGISFGRNIFNADYIGPYIHAVKNIVFEGYSLEQALDNYSKEIGGTNE